jgi:hypothetical protein
MAALTKEQWLSAQSTFLHGDAVLYLVDKVWEAATALVEEKFTPTNKQSTPCVICKGDATHGVRICYECNDRMG